MSNSIVSSIALFSLTLDPISAPTAEPIKAPITPAATGALSLSEPRSAPTAAPADAPKSLSPSIITDSSWRIVPIRTVSIFPAWYFEI